MAALPFPKQVEPPAHGLRQGLNFMSTAKEDNNNYVYLHSFDSGRNSR